MSAVTTKEAGMTWQSSLAPCCAAIVAGLADEGVWADLGAPQAVWVALMAITLAIAWVTWQPKT
jgi:hypothetical protein